MRLLERVKSDDRNPFEVDRALQLADQLPMRRSVARAISVALAVALIASGTLVGLAQVRNRRIRTTIAMVPGNTEPSPSPTTEPDVLMQAVEPEDLPSSEPSDEPASSPVECNNSTEKSCGDFYWIKQPGSNAPLKVSIVVSTPDPTAGEPVTFVVTVSDADAPNIDVWSTPSWGDRSSPVLGFALCITPAYGGWIPPPERPGTERFTFTHTYAEPGSYTFTIGAKSDSGDPWHTRCHVAEPYESVLDASTKIPVGAPPTESPTPSPSSTPTPTPTES
jgi:hypothetical protein